MICVINCGTDFLNEIKDSLIKLNCDFEVVDLENLKITDLTIYSGVIISGSPTMLTEVNQSEYLDQFQAIKTLSIPVLGICLGHQVLGLLYGAQINRGELISRQETIEILQPDPLFTDINNPVFTEEHSEFITLPDGFTLLAKSNSCGNEAMRLDNKQSVQFHPEVSGENGLQVFKNFLRLC